MLKFLSLNDDQKRSVLQSIAEKTPLPVQAIEKDIWVTNVLQAIFTLPIKDKLVFKGGTSLSKAWNLVERFSEDIDITIDRQLLGLPDGDLTKKQIKKLRKSSSLYVANEFATMLTERLRNMGLENWLTINIQPEGDGDNTYPEPRQIFIRYKSVFESTPAYIRSDIVLEIGARSLMEPVSNMEIDSIIGKHIPITPLCEVKISVAKPEKTFLEKVFLLHEIFSVQGRGRNAERKSRHLYDLYKMMNCDFANSAISNDTLWETIRHHREVFTSISGVDYTPDVRQRLQLVPGDDIIDIWKNDYAKMCESMIYGDKPSFKDLMEAMHNLQERFKQS